MGGSFIGRDAAGDLINLVQIPLDPEGRTAATHVMLPEYPQYVADLLASSGADSLSNYVGEAKMTSFDTAKQTALGYAAASGNPPVIKVIHHISGTMRFVHADTIMYSYISTMYLASADGFPSGTLRWGHCPLSKPYSSVWPLCSQSVANPQVSDCVLMKRSLPHPVGQIPFAVLLSATSKAHKEKD